MRVTDDIFQVGGGSVDGCQSDEYDCNVFLVDCHDGFILVDAGGGVRPELIERNITAAGYRLEQCRRVLLTHAHADHCGGAAWFREHTGADVYAYGEAARYVRDGDRAAVSLDVAIECGVYPAGFGFPPCPARELADAESFSVGETCWTVVGAPGHSSGHACYLMTAAGRRVLFAGDAVFPGGRVAVQPIWDCSPFAYAMTLERLAALQVDDLIPGHHGWTLGNGHEDILRARDAFRRLAVPENV